MNDPYLYPHTDVLKNLAHIHDADMFSQMEAEYTAMRLAELAAEEPPGQYDFAGLCETHRYIFQDIFEWAGKPRAVNIEKPEAALGGVSIEYSDCFDIADDAGSVLQEMNSYPWEREEPAKAAKAFSGFLAGLWKVHPFREGNTRTIVTFCCQFMESRGICMDILLFGANAVYLRTALVAASAVFSGLGDRRKPEYLERIVLDAIKNPIDSDAT